MRARGWDRKCVFDRKERDNKRSIYWTYTRMAGKERERERAVRQSSMKEQGGGSDSFQIKPL